MEIKIENLPNNREGDTGLMRVRRWFSNPVLLEWDESIPWSDAQRQTSYEEFVKLMRRLAVRVVPMGAVLFATGFWLIGRISGGGGPMPYSWQLKLAGPWLIFWLLPYVALRLGFVKPAFGTCVHIRIQVLGIQLVQADGTFKQITWPSFDAFEVGRWNGFDVLELRFRGSWLSRRFGRNSLTVEFCPARVSASSIREVLQDRGLFEEPLNETWLR